MASVEEYIGDSGKEFEVCIVLCKISVKNVIFISANIQSAAEKIVEGYMGEYMDKYMNEWYIQYCRFILILSINKSLMASDLRSCLLQGHGKILRPNKRVPDRANSQHHSWTKIDPNEAERCDCWKTSQ